MDFWIPDVRDPFLQRNHLSSRSAKYVPWAEREGQQTDLTAFLKEIEDQLCERDGMVKGRDVFFCLFH